MVIGAWFLAIYLQENGSWNSTIKAADSEKICVQAAKWRWQMYWQSGKEDDSDLRISCYDEWGSNRYFIRCTKYGSCTIK